LRLHQILSHGETPLEPNEINILQEQLSRILQGVPLAYVLGSWEFYGRSFVVTPDVLIPRPETELLVEQAIERARKFSAPSIVDVGTGSGVIAISLEKALPEASIIAVDLSLDALQVARRNACRHAADRIQFVQSDLLEPLTGQFDLMSANLPYIPQNTLANLEVAKWEPRLALDGGDSGLVVIKALLPQACARLAAGGSIFLEIEASLGEETLALAKEYFPQSQSHLFEDLAGYDRLIEISKIK